MPTARALYFGVEAHSLLKRMVALFTEERLRQLVYGSLLYFLVFFGLEPKSRQDLYFLRWILPKHFHHFALQLIDTDCVRSAVPPQRSS